MFKYITTEAAARIPSQEFGICHRGRIKWPLHRQARHSRIDGQLISYEKDWATNIGDEYHWVPESHSRPKAAIGSRFLSDCLKAASGLFITLCYRREFMVSVYKAKNVAGRTFPFRTLSSGILKPSWANGSPFGSPNVFRRGSTFKDPSITYAHTRISLECNPALRQGSLFATNGNENQGPCYTSAAPCLASPRRRIYICFSRLIILCSTSKTKLFWLV